MRGREVHGSRWSGQPGSSAEELSSPGIVEDPGDEGVGGPGLAAEVARLAQREPAHDDPQIAQPGTALGREQPLIGAMPQVVEIAKIREHCAQLRVRRICYNADHRRSIMNERHWDVIIVGGGVSAVMAAIASAGEGARTLLIERSGRLGGAGTTNMVQPYMGWSGCRDPRITAVLQRFAGENAKLHDLVLAEEVLGAGAELLLHTWCIGPIMDGDRVAGVRVLNKGGEQRFHARIVIDGSGDGDLAAGAGVPFSLGRDGDGLLQPMTIMYEVGGVTSGAFCCPSEEAARTITLPGGTWHDVVMAGRQRGDLPEKVGVIRLYHAPLPGRRIVNATQINFVNGLSAEDLTLAEVQGRQQARLVTAFLRAHAPGYEDCHIAEMPAAVGVRETRRFHGLETMTIARMASGDRLPDAIVREVCFPVDIHNPNGVGQAAGKAAKLPPYDIPYGCLVPVNRDGLLLTGRIISGTHEAHASYRVQQITMAIGLAAGTAAGLCIRTGCQPRALPVAAIQQRLGLAPVVAANDEGGRS